MNQINNYYLSEMEKIQLLTLEEEKDLATKAKRGDKAAFDKLVISNLRLVIKIANHYKGYMDIDDLIQEGNMGLFRAVKKYVPEHDNKFSTYAAWWIRAYIQKAIREISTGIRFPATRFKDMKDAKWKISSIDAVIGENETSLIDIIEDEKMLTPEESFYEKEGNRMINSLINTLNPKEKAIIVKRFGLNGDKEMSLSAVGEALGYSKERIRQIEAKALRNLRQIVDDGSWEKAA